MNLIQFFALRYAKFAMKSSLQKNFNIKILESGVEKIPQNNKEYMLYMHIPFCHIFCPYCSFHKYVYEEDIAKRYFNNLREEIKQIKSKGFDFSSMYIGGGTTLINETELLKTLELCKKLFNIKEISCESDPNHIKPEKLIMFKGLIDRLSCGVQSFDDLILQRVSRYHKFGSSEILQEKISKAVGILPTFSIDLIFNFPFQSEENLLNDIKIAKALKTEQVTFYPLMKSDLTRENIAKALGVQEKDNEYRYYQIILQEMKGYIQNNAWSFSNKKTKFNDEYVSSHHNYVGVGSGAFSFLDNELLINAFDLNSYERLVWERKNANIARATFDKKEILKYLFLTEIFSGKILIDKFNNFIQCDLQKDLYFEIMALKKSGAIKINNNEIITTSFGKYLFLTMMKDFYTGCDLIRAIFRNNSFEYGENISIMKQKHLAL